MPNSMDVPEDDFHVTLMTIYSVENAGIRYVSAALQREGFDTSIIFLRDWVHNSLTMPTEEEIEIAMEIIEQKRPKLIGLGFMSSLYPIALEVTRRIQERFPRRSSEKKRGGEGRGDGQY